jgi:hypothetical protein
MKRTIDAKDREIWFLQQELSKKNAKEPEPKSATKSREEDVEPIEAPRSNVRKERNDSSYDVSSSDIKLASTSFVPELVEKKASPQASTDEPVKAETTLEPSEVLPFVSIADSESERVHAADHPSMKDVDDSIYVLFHSESNKDLRAYDVEGIRVPFSSFGVSSDDIIFELRKSTAHQVRLYICLLLYHTDKLIA